MSFCLEDFIMAADSANIEIANLDMPSHATAQQATLHSDWYVQSMERLVSVVQELSHARSLDEVMKIVRYAARDLTHADGATFVLRDNGYCYYAEENAIGPLWKGKRFPLETCISGWAMLNGRPAVIEDIYKDARIPHDAYRPTFVKSLVMVPIRRKNPIGAIGNYWARVRQPTEEEVAILQALADVTSVALENADLYAQLQGKIIIDAAQASGVQN
jgi:GAF domain-containing protein